MANDQSIDIRQILSHQISTLVKIPEEKIKSLLEIPPNTEYGDFALPCFVLAKDKKQPPSEIAHDMANRLEERDRIGTVIDRIVASGPYLNIFIDRAFIGNEIISYLSSTEFRKLHEYGSGKTVIIDYSSPNIAKPFGIGHLRSTVIGNSLKKIYEFLGFTVVGVNHLGDWGTQFGKLITAFKKWGNRGELSKTDPIKYLYKLYVQFHREAEKDEGLQDEARQWFSKLENNDDEAAQLWEEFKSFSISEFKRIYKRLGVEFEYYTGESFYTGMLDNTIEVVKNRGVARVSEGALVVPLDGDELPPAILKKSDGSTLYITRDIAAALYRYRTFHFDLALYVVGTPQSLHFKQLFSVLEKMGKPWYKYCYHVPFGQIRFKESTMSTRKGNIIFLEDVLDKAVSLALKTIKKKNPDLKDKRRIAQSVGIGSIIFNDLKNYRIRDIAFDWEEMINFDGETGVYLQYTHARVCSLLKKYTERYGRVQFKPDIVYGGELYSICILLNDFEKTVIKAAEEFEPSIIARFLLEAASQFNNFYNKYRVITDDAQLSLSRAIVVSCVQKVIKQGLELLGIRAVEEM
jgi:arginyl-tRNA synthetase